MSFDPTRRRVARAIDRAQLAAALTRIEAGLHDDPDLGHAAAVALTAVDPDGLEIAWRPLDEGDVVATLAELDAPVGWLAFGVVCRGRARPLLDTGDDRPVADPGAEPTAVGLAVLVARSGVVVSGLRSGDAGFALVPGPAVVGRVPDACRRVLGLGTPPPTTPVAELWAACWLERVLEAGLDQPGELTWPAVEALRPDAALEALTWDDLRGFVARSAEPVLGVAPAIAAWMDDGMFSRELLAGLPPLGWLVTELDPVLADPVRRRLAEAVGRPGLP